jgi:acyl-coenzyme A thioesterase PaaI-like protein
VSRTRSYLVTEPPDDAVMPTKHESAPPAGTVIPPHYVRCFGCGPDQGSGLKMIATVGEELSVLSELEITGDHQGAPGLAHGGLIACAFDEALGALNWLLQRPAVTARLECDFRKPVPVGSKLIIEARIRGQVGRKIYGSAEGHLGDLSGPVAATATSLYIQVPIEHFGTHGRAEDIEWASSERSRMPRKYEINP